MQCTRCGNTLPDDVRFCQTCGQPVTTGLPVDATQVMADAGAQEASAAEVAARQEPVGYTGFVFQEFKPAPGVAPQPGAQTWPGLPATPVPGTPWPGAPGQPVPGMYAPYAAPGMPMVPLAPIQPKRRGRSVGCIVAYVLLAVLIVFVGLGVALFEVGLHLASNVNAQKTAAMQLYQQVTSTQPDLTDPMVGTPGATTSWNVFQQANYACSLLSDGLHVKISDKDSYIYCTDDESSYSNIAFQVQMQILSGTGGGLVFHVSGSNSQSLYIFELDQDGSYQIYLAKDPSTTPTYLTTGTTSAANTSTGATNTLTLIEKGKQYYFYVNGQYVTHVQDATLTDGEAGVLASNSSSSTEVLYTNAKIWDLNS